MIAARLTVIGLSAALPTACTAQPGSNGQAAPAAASNATSNAAGDSAAGLAAFRAEWLQACIGGARDAAPAGAPVERHCACAIDRMMAGKSLDQLEADRDSGAYRGPYQAEMRRCIREIPS